MKRKVCRKITGVTIALILVMTSGAMTGSIVSEASTNGATCNDAIAWAQSQVGHSVGYDDGSGYYQCVEFIQAYYQYLGADAVSGNGCDYAKNDLPPGWDRREGGIPQKGDILVYSKYTDAVQQNGHVAIYESDTVLYDQNGSKRGATVEKQNKYYRTYTYNYWGCIHPDFAPEIIPIDKATITVSDVTYTGKKLTPKPVVTYEGNTLVQGTDYECKYTNNKEIGLATVIIKGKGSYTGTVKANFKILPKEVSINKVTPAETTLLVVWKPKMTKPAITGYQVGYSKSSDMSDQKIITVKGSSKASKIINKLEGNTTYYVQLRTYKKVGKNNYYSNWSKTKTVTTKAPYHTKDGEIYNLGIKIENYMYVKQNNYIFKINLNTYKKTTFVKSESIIHQFCVNNGYLYFNSGDPQYNNPDDPKILYRKSLSGGDIEEIGRACDFKIVEGVIYAEYETNYDNYTDYYYYKCNLDGSNQVILKSFSDDGYHYNVNSIYKEFNVSGYKIIHKTANKIYMTHKSWLVKKSNKKKVYLGTFGYY